MGRSCQELEPVAPRIVNEEAISARDLGSVSPLHRHATRLELLGQLAQRRSGRNQDPGMRFRRGNEVRRNADVEFVRAEPEPAPAARR